MPNLDEHFAARARSKFRSRFHLGAKEAAYRDSKGVEVVMGHAADFVRNRGRQTPMGAR